MTDPSLTPGIKACAGLGRHQASRGAPNALEPLALSKVWGYLQG